jgi:transporter family protein
MGPTSMVAAIDKSSLLLVVLLAPLLLSEPLTWKAGIGALLIIGGVLVISL